MCCSPLWLDSRMIYVEHDTPPTPHFATILAVRGWAEEWVTGQYLLEGKVWRVLAR